MQSSTTHLQLLLNFSSTQIYHNSLISSLLFWCLLATLTLIFKGNQRTEFIVFFSAFLGIYWLPLLQSSKVNIELQKVMPSTHMSIAEEELFGFVYVSH